LLSGLSLFGGFWYAGERSGFVHYRLMAVLSVVGGVLLWVFGRGDSYALVGWHLGVLAIPLGIIGVWSLIRFLRSHPEQRDVAGG
jgi:hypothetical protein